MLKEKTGPRDWILFQLWPNNSMNWVVDLPNGEQFFKLEMVSHQNKPFKRMLGDLQDMLLSVKRTDLFQLLSQKFCLMVPTQLNTVKELLRKFWLLFSALCKRTTFFWKDVFWNLTWSLMDQLMKRRKKTIWKNNQSELSELFQDQFHQLWSELFSCQEVKLKRKLHFILTSWTKFKTSEDHGFWVFHSEELFKTAQLKPGTD